jgi:hypothetical protein
MTAIKDIKTEEWCFYGVGSRAKFIKTWGIPKPRRGGGPRQVWQVR